MPMGMIEAEGVHKTYDRGGAAVHSLRGASLDVAAGEFCPIMGPSWSGKSTLLHLLGGLDFAGSGRRAG